MMHLSQIIVDGLILWYYYLCRYDMWSVGVIILELILGSPNVFQISSKTRARLDQHLEGWNENLKELAYKWVYYYKVWFCYLDSTFFCSKIKITAHWKFLSTWFVTLDEVLLKAWTEKLFISSVIFWHPLMPAAFFGARLRSFMEMCILIPGIPTRLDHTSETKDHVSFWFFYWLYSL